MKFYLQNITNQLLVIIFILLFTNCIHANKPTSQLVNCRSRNNPTNFEKFYLKESYGEWSIDFLALESFSEKVRPNKLISSIQETYSLITKKFDEENEEKRSICTFEFDLRNNIIKKDVKSLISRDLIISLAAQYQYSPIGLLIKKIEKNHKKVTNVFDSTSDERFEYFYNGNGQLIKKILKGLSDDSTVVKYEYFMDNLNKAYVYNMDGKRIYEIIPSYDNQNNTLSLRTFDVRYNSQFDYNLDNVLSAITIYFDDNCDVNMVTKVKANGSQERGYNIEYSRIKINKQGDITEHKVFETKNLKQPDFNYYEYDSFSYKVKKEYKYYSNYEYQYDTHNNWTFKRNGDNISRRIINYRIQ